MSDRSPREAANTIVDRDVPTGAGRHRHSRDSILPERESVEDPLVGSPVEGLYVVERALADGGMGRVYVARDPTGAKVALKTLLPRFSKDEELVARFRRELETLRKAQCPHVVELYAWGELPDDRAYFVMEYIDGIPLADVLEDGAGRIDARRALRIILQVCDALTPAHRLGIVHRDLKPENIMLTRIGDEEDVVKVLDFGLAKPTNNRFGLTNPGHVLGTPDYMSPEQIKNQSVDHRTDIYSLGVLMYELLCGEVPFPYEEVLEVVRGHLHEKPTPPSRRDPPVQIPKPLEWMLLCCLHKEPERRFQSMDEVQEEMGHIAGALGVEVPNLAR